MPVADKRLPLIVAAVVVVAAIALGIWLATGAGDGDEPAVPARGPIAARLVAEADVRALARRLDHPVFWLGPSRGTDLELTYTRSGRVYLRYLGDGARAGDRRLFPTVATYPLRGGYEALRRAGAEEGSRLRRLADGGLMLETPGRPTSVVLSYPAAPYQVEVFHPSAGRARQLVVAGRLTPVPR